MDALYRPVLYQIWMGFFPSGSPVLVPDVTMMPFTLEFADRFSIAFSRNNGRWITNPLEWVHSSGVGIYLPVTREDYAFNGFVLHRANPGERLLVIDWLGTAMCIRDMEKLVVVGMYLSDNAALADALQAYERTTPSSV